MSRAYLPQHDPDPALRQPGLAARREQYVYDPAIVPPFVVYHKLPAAEIFTAGYFSERLSSSVGVPANFAAVKLANLIDRFDELQDYEDLFKLFDPPAIVRRWRDDSMFAEQRLAGMDCRVLRRITRLPDNLRLPAADFAAITGLPLDLAAAEGRLHLADYDLLDGIEPGESHGLAKFLHAPLALFCWQDDPGSDDHPAEHAQPVQPRPAQQGGRAGGRGCVPRTQSAGRLASEPSRIARQGRREDPAYHGRGGLVGVVALIGEQHALG